MKKIFLIGLALFIFGLSGCQPKENYLKLEEKRTKEEKAMVRKAVVAGSFYPAEKEKAEQKIDELLAKTKKLESSNFPLILILPHAGWDFSGQTAAWGIKQLEGKDYRQVILIGVSHRVWLDKAAIFSQGAWETPLGKVEIDENLSQKLLKESKWLETNFAVHNQEHSLEVELPFLQKSLKNFKIVPILLGQPKNEVIEDLAAAIEKNLTSQTLILISTDLSHYPSAQLAEKVDQKTIELILNQEIEEFSQWVKASEAGKIEGIETAACGSSAVLVGLNLAKKLKLEKGELIYSENSGDVTGEKTRVVGYAAIAFYGNNQLNFKPEEENFISEEGQKKLLKLARETLVSYLGNKKVPEVKIEDEELNQKLGVFVTLRKDGQLRGCIGEFEPQKPLYRLVQEKSIDAAVNDPRFYPVTLSELPTLKIEISVLSPPQKISQWQEIELGKHGVLIKKGNRGGTFLPQVAKETGWEKEEFLTHLCVDKAGLPSDCYKDPQTQLFTYTAQVFEEE